MTEQSGGSLAEQAAAWVPPWERNRDAAGRPTAAPEPEPGSPPSEPEVAPEQEAAPGPEPEVEPEPLPGMPEAGPASDPDPEPDPDPDPEPDPEVDLPTPELRAALEAILLVVDEPAGESMLAQVLGQPVDRVAATLTALAAEYTDAGRGFDLRRVAGGWRFYTRPEQASFVERFVLDGQQARLTQAALETLAVVAYRQPVTRSRVAAIRGVNCDGVIRTLLTRGLVEEAGTEPESGAYLYRTTSVFLEKLGLNSVAELPPLAPFLPDDVDALSPDSVISEVARPATGEGDNGAD